MNLLKMFYPECHPEAARRWMTLGIRQIQLILSEYDSF